MFLKRIKMVKRIKENVFYFVYLWPMSFILCNASFFLPMLQTSFIVGTINDSSWMMAWHNGESKICFQAKKLLTEW